VISQFSETSDRAVVLPKGLRSFDQHDADFFQDLLPGPRDRNGLPDSLRFWRTRIQASDADESFQVGLIYGPSGCGKSSFVKAGLIPCLGKDILPIFVESSSAFTEERILHALRKKLPWLDSQLGLPESFAAIRRRDVAPQNKKVLLVLDQFEQWLHGRQENESHELIRAFRQCDGERIQAMLLVRSDFWMSVTRLLDVLEVELVQGKNIAAVDLFPPRHARKVLTAFGRAFGTLPDSERLNAEQQAFIHQAVDELAIDGKLICVRLALFAEMMKNRPWTQETLSQIGGTEGVGVSYLEECFGNEGNPKVRLHQFGARSVLKALLPDARTRISNAMRSYDELMQASGYRDKKAFDQLIGLLDTDLRLISPTDPLGIEFDGPADRDTNSATGIDPDQKYFRLTHDYLVTALRKWLNRKQRETRKGRAELMLAERAAFWNEKQENRYLPSLLEHARVRLLTSPSQWNESEQQLMKSATKVHGRLLGVTAIFAAISIAGIAYVLKQADSRRRDREAIRVVESLLTADTSRVADVIKELEPLRSFAADDLRHAFEMSSDGSSEKLHAAMALMSDSRPPVEYLASQIPLVEADQLLPVMESLQGHSSEVVPSMTATFLDQHQPPRQRLAAASAIAQFDPDNEIWDDDVNCRFVAEQLIRVFPSELAPMRITLAPVANKLVPTLSAVFEDPSTPAQQRMFATETMVAFNGESTSALFELLLASNAEQFPLVFAGMGGNKALFIELARAEIKKIAQGLQQDVELDQFASRKANAAVALYQLGLADEIWPLLNPDNGIRVSSFLVHALASHGSLPDRLIEKLDDVADERLRRHLLFAIGEFSPTRIDASDLEQLVAQAQTLFRNANDAATRSASRWLLVSIGQKPIVDKIEKEQIQSDLQRLAAFDKRTELLNAKAQKFETWRQKLVAGDDFGAWLDGLSTSVVWPLDRKAESELIKFPASDKASTIELTAGPFGSAWRFDGTSAVQLGQQDVPDTDGSFGFGCWFQVGSSNQYGSVISRMDPDNGLRGFDIWLNDGLLCAHVKNRWIDHDDPNNRYIKKITHCNVSDGNWHHVMVTYDGSGHADGLAIFLDGELIKEFEIEGDLQGESVSTDCPLLVGGRATGLCFRGDVCRVRVLGDTFRLEDAPKVFRAEIQQLAQTKWDQLGDLQRSILEREFLRTIGEEHGWREQVHLLWQGELNAVLESSRDWFFNKQSQPMIRLKADEARVGSPPGEMFRAVDEYQLTRQLDRTFAISATEVTQRQWKQFLLNGSPSRKTIAKFDRSALDSDRPVVGISWFEAVEYCNWLSKAEGIPEQQWCYVPHPTRRYAPGMTVKREFWRLTGYRLPTQVEWEYACRGGAGTSRYYGSSEQLLPKYAWFLDNSNNEEPATVARLKPNPFGLHDMLGNAMEWCFDPDRGPLPNVDQAPDFPQTSSTVTNDPRTIRGGAAYDSAKFVRCSHRNSYQPTSQTAATGIRVVRTLKDSSPRD
jgi:formylglycine-generating enzyme required for sulfatase activity